MSEIVRQDNGCAAEELSETERRLKHLENEVHMFTRAGVVEIAVRNPSVMEYMKHWEGRAEKAEAEVARLTTALENARKDGWIECREEAMKVASNLRDYYKKEANGHHSRQEYEAANIVATQHDTAHELWSLLSSLTPPTEKAT